ncbi:MAG: potassium channel family protein [Pseudomonadota bacterium]
MLIALQEAAREESSPLLWIGAVLISVYFFVDVVLLVPFRTSNTFRVNVPRLFRDTLISSAVNISAFATVYIRSGIDPNGSPLDHLYFSAVTFSTLGFGDYSPEKSGKLFAAFEALLGNLHLGFIVAATFAALQMNSTK